MFVCGLLLCSSMSDYEIGGAVLIAQYKGVTASIEQPI